jgi:hypothetical protein
MSDYKKIILKNSPTAGAVPLQEFLDHGELALNYADNKIYYKTLNGSIVVHETPNIDIASSPNSIVRRNLDGSGIFNGVISTSVDSDIYSIYATHSSKATAKIINTGVCTAAEISSDNGIGAEINSIINIGAKIYSTSETGAQIYSASGTGARIYSSTSGLGAEISSQTNSGAKIYSVSGKGAEISSSTGLGLLISSEYGSGAEISIGGTATDTIGLEINTTSGTGLSIDSVNGVGIVCNSDNDAAAEFFTENGPYHVRFGQDTDPYGLGISAPNASIDWFKISGGVVDKTGKLQTTITANRTWTLPDASGTILLDSALTDGSIVIPSGNFTGSLSGDVTGTQTTTAIAATTVTGKALTNYVTGTTAATVEATDTILQAFQKINGNVNLRAPLASPTFTGTVTLPAGTTTVAPLKLTTGVNLTTPVAGSIEFDGASIYITNSSAARKTIAYTDSTVASATTAGSATTATTLATGRTIALTGDVTYSTSFNGSSNVSGTATIANKAVTFAKIADSAAAGLSVIGRSTNTAGVFAEISAGTDGHVLRRNGSTIGWGTIANSATTATSDNEFSTIASRSSTGAIFAATATAGSNTDQLATTKYVATEIGSKANLASPTFTGTVTLPAGTATVAPLKLATGVNLTTPVLGSIEFDGTNLYLTNNAATPTRNTIAFTAPGVPNGTGKIITVNSTNGIDIRTGLNPYVAPYASIAAAVTDSTFGDLIYVRAGSYTITTSVNLQGEGNLYFEPGTTVTVSGGNAAFVCPASESKKICGYADFIVNGTASLVSLTSATPKIYFECNSITGVTTATLFSTNVSSELNVSISGSGIDAGSSTIFSLNGNSKIAITANTVSCNKYLIANGTATSRINSKIQNLSTSNTTSGIDITQVGTANFYIDHYTHDGVGLSCSWAQDTQDEKIAFINTLWYSSVTTKNHISLDSSATTVITKRIKLVGTNTFCGLTGATNSITSTKAVNVYVQNSYAATAATTNVSFKVGMFTVDTDVNKFN